MKYLIDEKYLLRGWHRVPYALVNRETKGIIFLRETQWKAVLLCDGKTSVVPSEVDGAVNEVIRQLVEKGLAHECSGSDCPAGLSEEQKYVFYDNRFIRDVHWSVTGKCNYNCRHCYMSAPQAKLGELPHGQIMDIIAQLEKAGIFKVSITGGEPLVREDFLQIVDELTKRGIKIVSIYSNGALVDRALLEQLAGRGVFPEFNMSFDGIGWHDWLRGIDGAEKVVLDAFDLCHVMGFPTGAEMCLHKGNIGTMAGSVRLLAEHHVASLKTNPISSTELWRANGSGKELSTQELYQAYLDYIPVFYADGAPLAIQLGGFFGYSRREKYAYIPSEKFDGSEDCLKQCVCGHARNVMYISPEGRMLPCMALASMDEVQKDFPLIGETGLAEGITDSTYMKLIDTRIHSLMEQNPGCAACDYRYICGGGCRASALSFHPGDLMACDEMCCTFFKEGWYRKVLVLIEKYNAAGGK